MNTLVDVLNSAEPLFLLPRDDVANNVISPALTASQSAAIMMGFFSSASLSEIAPGLAAYLRNSTKSLRLIVSPFISEQDQEALRNGSENAGRLIENIFSGLQPNAEELATHTLSCLAWLISEGRLEMKIAVMRDALFHSKVWLFEDGGDHAVLHGSANMTGNGLTKNREQMALARNWKNEECARTYMTLANEFDTLWNGEDIDCITVPISDALRDKIVKQFKGEQQPNPRRRLLRAWTSYFKTT